MLSQAAGTMTQYPTQSQYPDTEQTSPCPILVSGYIVTSITFVNHLFDSARVGTRDLPQSKPAGALTNLLPICMPLCIGRSVSLKLGTRVYDFIYHESIHLLILSRLSSFCKAFPALKTPVYHCKHRGHIDIHLNRIGRGDCVAYVYPNRWWT